LASNKKNKVQSFACSHWLMVDKADEFNHVVADWIKKE
jgi:pimeloyl-ACP methyl ester carboxylesterase